MNIGDIKRKAKAYLAKKDKQLTITESFKHTVLIQHGDGSHFTLINATHEYKAYGKTELLLVWTEHCGYFYFFTEDLEQWSILAQV